MPRRVYLDYHATTPLDPRVAEVVSRCQLEVVGNPASDHAFGDEAAAIIDTARLQVADLVGSTPECVVFTSGATESVNLAIQGFLPSRRSRMPPRILVSAVEHHAVLDTCRALGRRGLAEVVEIPVDELAQIDMESVERGCRDGAALVCLMAANNEVGTIYPVREVGLIAGQHGAAFFCDASQACGKVSIDCTREGITLLALSGHKFYGPKGVGALIVPSPHAVEPILFGGGQEAGLRPGTMNVPAIAGLGEACRLRALEMTADEIQVRRLRDELQEALVSSLPGLRVNGDLQHRLAGNLHVSIPDTPNQAVIARVRGVLAIGTGSACSSGLEAPSHVLRAMNLASWRLDGALRFGLGKFTTRDDVLEAAHLLPAAVRDVRSALAQP
jgi:cysteine desulfurase